MKLFLKSIIVGLGGIAPGLSGSVLMIIFGLYQDALEALGTLFVDFRKKLRFLLPLVCGMVTGVLLFSKLLNFFLETWEMPTRFAFLGLILGTVPLFYKETKKHGFSNTYYLVIAASAVIGLLVFTANPNRFPQIADPNFLQKVLLGAAAAVSLIVPGVDPAVFLSSLGLYELYLSALADFRLDILLPMVIGLALGGIAVSFIMTRLFKRWYTATFSVVFGLFLSMIPNMLNESCYLALDWQTIISILLLVAGFFLSLYLGKIEKKP